MKLSQITTVRGLFIKDYQQNQKKVQKLADQLEQFLIVDCLTIGLFTPPPERAIILAIE